MFTLNTSVKQLLLAAVCTTLAACHSTEQISGSSVRFLRGAKMFNCGYRPGYSRHVIATAYVGDSRYTEHKYEKLTVDPNVTFNVKPVFGLRIEAFRHRFGFGFDYSLNKVSSAFPTAMHGFPELYTQTQYEKRLNFSFSYTLFWRGRLSGYMGVQSGCEWSKQNVRIEDVQLNGWEKSYSAKFNCRIASGVYYKIKRRINLNLELGYGAGAYVRGGVGVWVW